MNDRMGDDVPAADRRDDTASTALSRRLFLKGALYGTVVEAFYPVALLGRMAGLAEAWAREIPSGAPHGGVLPRAAGHVERVSADESACASCGLCSLVCAAVHGDAFGPSCSGIGLRREPFVCEYETIVCLQCAAPECYYACETQGAFFIDEMTGARAIDGDKCVGCGRCVEACVFEISRIQLDAERGAAFKCDLCSGRPEGPACVEFCPRQALRLVGEGDA